MKTNWKLVKTIMMILAINTFSISETWAGSITYPSSYPNIVNGNPASASDVTDAFEAVKTEVNENDSRINTIKNGINNHTNNTGAHHTPYTNADAETAVRAAGFVESVGAIRINAGWGNWHKENITDPVTLDPALNLLKIRTTATVPASFWLYLIPNLPTTLFSKQMEIYAVEHCHNTASTITPPPVTLTRIRVRYVDHTPTTGSGNTTVLVFDDATVRSEDACQTYTLLDAGTLSTPSPVILTNDRNIIVSAQLSWIDNTAGADFGRTSFLLRPVSATAASTQTSKPIASTQSDEKMEKETQ